MEVESMFTVVQTLMLVISFPLHDCSSFGLFCDMELADKTSCPSQNQYK